MRQINKANSTVYRTRTVYSWWVFKRTNCVPALHFYLGAKVISYPTDLFYIDYLGQLIEYIEITYFIVRFHANWKLVIKSLNEYWWKVNLDESSFCLEYFRETIFHASHFSNACQNHEIQYKFLYKKVFKCVIIVTNFSK